MGQRLLPWHVAVESSVNIFLMGRNRYENLIGVIKSVRLELIALKKRKA